VDPNLQQIEVAVSTALPVVTLNSLSEAVMWVARHYSTVPACSRRSPTCWADTVKRMSSFGL